LSRSATPFPVDFSSRLLAREEAAWREAFARLWPVALCAAGHVLKQRGDAEDAAADALADLAERTELPDSWAALEAYTAVIARRRAISLVRKRTAAKRGSGETLSLDFIAEEPAVETVADASLDLSTLLAQLDPERRRIVEEHFLDGRTSEEIGSRLQLNPATVRSHLLRSVQKLRRWLNPPSP
jgi:RNA polymerase sigma factor (sigma-70 family)